MLKVMPSQTIAREVQIAAGFAEDSQIPLPEISFADRYLEAVSLGTRAEVYPQGVLDDFRQWSRHVERPTGPEEHLLLSSFRPMSTKSMIGSCFAGWEM